jgi:hypothetical protein
VGTVAGGSVELHSCNCVTGLDSVVTGAAVASEAVLLLLASTLDVSGGSVFVGKTG